MQQAVLHHFPDVQATYRFTHRDKDRFFSEQCIQQFCSSVSRQYHSCPCSTLLHVSPILDFSGLSLKDSELDWLRKTCPFFKSPYLEYLSKFRFKPEQVKITFEPKSADGTYGNVEIEATGPWVETIFWEVPLMACLSEIFFQTVDTDWSYRGQEGELPCSV